MRERCVGCAEVISHGENVVCVDRVGSVDCVGACVRKERTREFLLGCAEYGTSPPEPVEGDEFESLSFEPGSAENSWINSSRN